MWLCLYILFTIFLGKRFGFKSVKYVECVIYFYVLLFNEADSSYSYTVE
jgi:hypothetical protein